MFKVDELVRATGGRLRGGPATGESLKGICIDSRTLKKGEAFLAIKGGNFDGHDYIDAAIKKGARCIIRQRRARRLPAACLPGRQGQARRVVFIEVKDTTRALGDIARYHRQRFDVPVIAVTGSNGKTTTKDMIAWVLAKRHRVLKNEGTKNNHIGVPLTLLRLGTGHDMVVLEIGTNHFGEVGNLAGICQPTIGVITNIGPAHLEYFGSLGGVFKEKSALLEKLLNPNIALLNADDDALRAHLYNRADPLFALWFGLRRRCDFQAKKVRYSQGEIHFFAGTKHPFRLRTPGAHNVYNALSAIAVARMFGMGYKDIASRLSSFEFPQGRLTISKHNGARIIDDTYNANPHSLVQALAALKSMRARGRKIFVMGDMLELGSQAERFHSEAGRLAAQSCTIFIGVGRLSGRAAETARSCGLDTKNTFSCETAKEARVILFKTVQPDKDDIVLVKGSRGMRMEEVFL